MHLTEIHFTIGEYHFSARRQPNIVFAVVYLKGTTLVKECHAGLSNDVFLRAAHEAAKILMEHQESSNEEQGS